MDGYERLLIDGILNVSQFAGDCVRRGVWEIADGDSTYNGLDRWYWSRGYVAIQLTMLHTHLTIARRGIMSTTVYVLPYRLRGSD